MEENRKRKAKTESQMKSLQFRFFFTFVGIIIVSTVISTFVLLKHSSLTLQDKVSTLMRANNRQQVLNVNYYLEKVEKNAALFFSDDAYCEYDASSNKLDEFDRINQETMIADRIEDLGLMENFSDFGIIYANDKTIGWISNTTKKLYPEGELYSNFASKISDETVGSGWFFDYQGSYNRMYYVKRLNANAVLIVSFYSNELSSVFEIPEELSDMTIRLVDENHTILYSSNEKEISQPLDDSINNMIDRQGSFSAITDEELINSSICSNGWIVVSSIPKSQILKEIDDLRIYTFIFATIIIILVIIVGFVVLRQFSKPMDNIFMDLQEKAEYDQLSGLLNKSSFQELATLQMQDYEEKTVCAFVMIDMDNFKKVNDILGHSYGDEVIERFGHLLSRIFGKDMLIGRMGGDEFAMFVRVEFSDSETVINDISSDIDLLLTVFLKEFAAENESCDTSLSIGIAVTDDNTVLYEDLYNRADTALYNSKKNGKCQYSVYSKESGGEENEQ